MKYKVIGWTWYENYNIPFSDDTIGFAERNAIIDEIKKHKYLFTGWDHQESWESCVPILNDGKKRGFSQRGWGGVMAEAYGDMGDYDYSNYTFHGRLNSPYVKYPSEEYNTYNFISEPLEHEHFDVNISKELFEIAKTSNPFYLEDLDELRFIDTDDTITLHYDDEALTFLVAEIDRSKKEHEFKNHHLISGKYKIILTHKPMGKVLTRKPVMILRDNANTLFKEAIKNYDFYTLYELFYCYDMDFVTNKSKSKKAYESIKRFVLEYIEYSFNERLVLKVLNYLKDYEFFKEIALKTIDINGNIFEYFVNKYFKEGMNMDEFIPLLLKKYKGNDYYIMDLLLRAVELNPAKKGLRKRYYKVAKESNLNGLFLLVGINDYKSLIKADKKYIELDDFSKRGYTIIRHIVEMMVFPNNPIKNEDDYPFKVPTIYSTPYECIKEGVIKYQNFVNEHFDLSNRLEELIWVGIDKKCKEMDEYLYEERNSLHYVQALDMLTDYKYSLLEKALEKYPKLKDGMKE